MGGFAGNGLVGLLCKASERDLTNFTWMVNTAGTGVETDHFTRIRDLAFALLKSFTTFFFFRKRKKGMCIASGRLLATLGVTTPPAKSGLPVSRKTKPKITYSKSCKKNK